jgi:hypothetical protein
MTGLVPVIWPNASAFGDVVKPPEKLRIGRKRRRVDGRDKPGHDGEGSLTLIPALMPPSPPRKDREGTSAGKKPGTPRF